MGYHLFTRVGGRGGGGLGLFDICTARVATFDPIVGSQRTTKIKNLVVLVIILFVLFICMWY